MRRRRRITAPSRRMKPVNCTIAWRACEMNWPAGIMWNGLSAQSAAMKRVRAQVELAAAGTGTVLVLGPAGSGRQHVARTIHFAQQPPLGTFAAGGMLDAAGQKCLRSTIASLITRHSQPANNARVTLLLSDVHLLPAEVQPDVLRWLTTLPNNIRMMATATQPLESLASSGLFLPNLAHRA